MKIKIIEGEPAGFVSRGTHRMDLTGYDAVLIIRDQTKLHEAATDLIEFSEALEVLLESPVDAE